MYTTLYSTVYCRGFYFTLHCSTLLYNVHCLIYSTLLCIVKVCKLTLYSIVYILSNPRGLVSHKPMSSMGETFPWNTNQVVNTTKFLFYFKQHLLKAFFDKIAKSAVSLVFQLQLSYFLSFGKTGFPFIIAWKDGSFDAYINIF